MAEKTSRVLIQISDPSATSAVHACFDLYVDSPDGQLSTSFAFDGVRPGPG